MIAGVSAATYRYMYINGSITVGQAKLIWIKGADAPVDASIQGSTVTIDLDVEPGTPLNFTNCLFIKNNVTTTYTMNITITSPVTAADFDEAKIHIYENSTGSWLYVDTLDMTIDNDAVTSLQIAQGEYYRLSFEIAAKTTASGQYTFSVEVDYV
jgi:hypothetical protein